MAPRPDHPSVRNGRVRTRLAAVLLVPAVSVAVLTLGAACTSSARDDVAAPATTGAGTSTPIDRISFTDVDVALTDRIAADDLPGAADLVVRTGTVVHRQTYGAYRSDTVVPIASASKWLTTAVIMTLVDEGKVALDDPVGRYLPSWSAAQSPDKATITLRQLLSHRAGLPSSDNCLGDPTITLGQCADEIARVRLQSAPGAEFHYGNAGYTVAARVAEVVGGADIEALLQARIARPLGLIHTSLSPPERGPTRNPIPAASGVSTLDDYGAFVAMMLGRGVAADGRRVLSEGAVAEIEKNQVEGLDTHDDPAVQITGVATYGLGLWRDRSDPKGTAVMVSGSGSVGFYPWLDRERQAYGVLVVNDGAGSTGRAVRESARIVHELILPATDHAR